MAVFSQCENANISICASTSTLPFIVTAYNSLPRHVVDTLRIPSPVDSSKLIVTDGQGVAVPFDTFPNPSYDIRKSCCA